MLLKGDKIFYIREIRYLKIAWKMTYHVWLGVGTKNTIRKIIKTYKKKSPLHVISRKLFWSLYKKMCHALSTTTK